MPADHLFYEAVSWLADQGITRGCNPPRNDRFCPDQPVTRGQMAAFLVRALRLPKGDVVFADTKGHLFEADIAALAAAGITRGCNPPRNDRFCPDDVVTRGQMAAFLVRALRLPAGDATFSDTSGHVFEADIAALASAGITRGCNPPANDRFCPDEPATRGQMAAFLFRAIPGQPLAITSAALPAGQVGDAYSATLEASGGTPPYVWSADGLPSGLNIDQPSGVISGTPTEAGTFPVEFTVTDSRGTSVTETLNLVVREPAPGPDPGGEDDSAGGEDDPGNGEEPDIELEYSSLSSGGAHTCGLTASGAAYCWGSGRYGRLGNGDSDNRLVPTPVAGDLT
ncbi:MAG: S-layer homology domain-containing protein, partial [Actinomycetes bacterium]